MLTQGPAHGASLGPMLPCGLAIDAQSSVGLLLPSCRAWPTSLAWLGSRSPEEPDSHWKPF